MPAGRTLKVKFAGTSDSVALGLIRVKIWKTIDKMADRKKIVALLKKGLASFSYAIVFDNWIIMVLLWFVFKPKTIYLECLENTWSIIINSW